MGHEDPTRARARAQAQHGSDATRDPLRATETSTAIVEPSGEAEQTTAESDAPRAPERRLVRGASVGRYVVVDALASGGMGSIWIAYDPELDRRVAIKILERQHVDELGGEDSLLREAQALAKLSHPNVVNVFDTGLDDGEVFVAMEYVEGVTLRAWLRAEPRSWREVLDVYIQAGRGLAAAHRAGIVHRDFKPANVMVDHEQRARVLDFGLAHRVTAEDTDDIMHSGRRDSLPAPSGKNGDPEGTVHGTPAYMSPEQWLGAPLDHRSDEFSFCVALWDAMYAGKPFVGRRLSELRKHIVTGTLQPPGKPRGPARLRRHLLRGLSVDPEKRYRDMTSLLDALESDAQLYVRRSVYAAVGGGGMVLLGLGYWSAPASSDGAEVCGGAAKRIASVWNDEHRARLRDAFEGSGKAYAAVTFRSVETTLDRTTEEWSQMFAEACQATRTRQEQSEAMLDRRMRCLDRRLVEVRSTVELLIRAEGDTLARAVGIAERITPISQCSVAEVTIDEVPPPAPEIAADVDAIEAQIAEAFTLIRTGRYTEADAIVQQADERAQKLDYPPLVAGVEIARTDSLIEQSKIDEARESLHRGYVAAIAGGDDRRAAQLSAIALRIEAARADERAGKVAIGLAESWQERGSAPPRVQYMLEAYAGVLMFSLGDYEQARTRFERSLEIARARLPTEHQRIAATLNNLGSVAGSQGRYDESLAYLQEALVIEREVLGERHPSTALTLENIALNNHQVGRSALARKQLEEALEIVVELFGETHTSVARSYNNLSSMTLDLGNSQEALTYATKALQLREETIGSSHPGTALAHNAVANALLALKRYDEAQHHIDRAVEILDRPPEPHPHLATALAPRAELRLHRGDLDGAWADLDRLVELQRQFSLPEAWLARVEAERAKLMAVRGDDADSIRARVTIALAKFEALEHPAASERERSSLKRWLDVHPQYRPPQP